jgi:hypothetical protein
MNNKYLKILNQLKNQKGISVILVAVSIVALLGFTAFAIDFGHRHVVKNELQNAADAGALAGARQLYYEDGSAVNAGQAPTAEQPDSANQVGKNAAVANIGQGVPVEVNWTTGNLGDVQRGHWSFGLTADLDKGFYPNDSTLPTIIAGVSEQDLDKNTDFINAVKVVARRQLSGTPVISFFARIFGFGDYELDAEAVAYIGFASDILPTQVDQPIAICKDSIIDSTTGALNCSQGRMINSGQNPSNSTGETGGWTTFDQPCTGSNSQFVQDMKDLICGGGNPKPLKFNQLMQTDGGQIGNIFKNDPNSLMNCWANGMNDEDNPPDGVRETPVDQLDSNGDPNPDGVPDRPWNITLPVVLCPKPNIENCSLLVGAVNLNVIWMVGNATGQCTESPYIMTNVSGKSDWSSSDPDGCNRWDSFVSHFNLVNNVDADNDGNLDPAPHQQQSIQFLPDCTYHEPGGGSGGNNFGILAEIPVLVD